MIVMKYGRLPPEDMGIEYIKVKCPRCKTKAKLADKDVIHSEKYFVKYKCPLCGHEVDSKRRG